MTPSNTHRERLRRLREDYRAAFKTWIAAQGRLRIAHERTGDPGFEDLLQPAREAEAAALAYAEARNRLTHEMLSVWKR